MENLAYSQLIEESGEFAVDHFPIQLSKCKNFKILNENSQY